MTFAFEARDESAHDADSGMRIRRLQGPEMDEFNFEVESSHFNLHVGCQVGKAPCATLEPSTLPIFFSLEGFNFEMVRLGRMNKSENNELLAYILQGIKLIIPHMLAPRVQHNWKLWTNKSIEDSARKLRIPVVVDVPTVRAIENDNASGAQ